MNLDDNVNTIVQTIIAEITTQVQQQVAEQIDAKIADIVNNLDATSILSNLLNQKLDQVLGRLPIDSKSIESQLLSRLDTTAATMSTNIQAQATAAITESIATQVNNINFQQLCESTLISAIENQKINYAKSSIAGDAIDIASLIISGDNVQGGIIRNFGSTGIDDKAENCQLTIMDEVTVVENNLLTQDLTVKGTVTVEGDLNVTGAVTKTSALYVSLVADAAESVKTNLDSTLFNTYADTVFNRIRDVGLDLTKITLNQNPIMDESGLANSIRNSNLEKVGLLKELQVAGESYLSGTLYSTRNRVGVNTIEPARALSIWDQDIEIGFGKQSNNTAVIETPRVQNLVLSSNGKNNLVLDSNGGTTVNTLTIGHIAISTSPVPPTNSQPKGCIVFNANPTLGGPMGWVSLGDARWANFGIID
jgi:hypothetical protein